MRFAIRSHRRPRRQGELRWRSQLTTPAAWDNDGLAQRSVRKIRVTSSDSGVVAGSLTYSSHIGE